MRSAPRLHLLSNFLALTVQMFVALLAFSSSTNLPDQTKPPTMPQVQHGSVSGDLIKVLAFTGQTFHAPVVAELAQPYPTDLEIPAGIHQLDDYLRLIAHSCPTYTAVNRNGVIWVYNKRLYKSKANFLNQRLALFRMPAEFGPLKLFILSALTNPQGNPGGLITGIPAGGQPLRPLVMETLRNITAREVLFRAAEETTNLFSLSIFPNDNPTTTAEKDDALANWMFTTTEELTAHRLFYQSMPARKIESYPPAPLLTPFLQKLLQTRDPAALPSFQERLKVQAEIPKLRPEQISAVLPLLFLALKNPAINIQIEAAMVLWSIAHRPDGGMFLEPYLQDIAALYDSPDARLQSTASLVFGMLRPPAPAAVPLVVRYLNRTDRDPGAQTGAIFFLVRHGAEDRDAVAAVEMFLARRLDPSSRVDALNALGNSRMGDRVIDSVITSLEDPDPGVRFTAVQVIPSLGQNALLQAQPELERLAGRADENEQTRDFARKALKGIQR